MADVCGNGTGQRHRAIALQVAAIFVALDLGTKLVHVVGWDVVHAVAK